MTIEATSAIFHVDWRRPSTDDRMVTGIAVPWNETTYLADDPRGERFLPGSLTRSVKAKGGRLKLFRGGKEHEYSHAVGSAVDLDPRHPQGLMTSWRIAQTPHGNEALDEIAEGMLDAFSVRFRPIRAQRGADGAREIAEAELVDVTILPVGAYDGARVLEVRAPQTDQRPALAELNAWLAEHPTPAVDRTPLPELHRFRP